MWSKYAEYSLENIGSENVISIKKNKKKLFFPSKGLGPVWYMCLKTENCCLKTFVKIRVGEKVY